MPPDVRAARLRDLDPLTLYALLRLRTDVFVVEQQCAYPELDGRDPEPGTEHLWLEIEAAPVATLRILRGDDAAYRIGRVATHHDHRGRGYAARLMTEALRRVGDAPVDIEAQTYLQEWYERFGFRRTGPDYLEDGIPHLPMRREA